MLSSEEIKQRNIDEGRSYRNIIEFTEHGYRFKPEVDVGVKQNIFVSTMPKGARKLKDVYEDLGTYVDAAHYAGFKQFISSLEQGLEGVADGRKAALVNHYVGGKKIDLSKDKSEVYYLTAEGAQMFQAFYTQSPTKRYKVREQMLREQELEHQSALGKDQYIVNPLQQVIEKFKRVSVVNKDDMMDTPASQTSAQGEVDVLVKGKGKST